jgi:hypothetical protein
MTVEITRTSSPAELAAIRALQLANLRQNLSAADIESQGFVTAEYPLPLLEAMHRDAPAIIAKDGDAVVAYALVATQASRNSHPLLADLFDVIDRHQWRGTPLKQRSYVVCGQLCVARSHRGLGLVPALYANFRTALADRFDCLVTDVASDNPRSLKAHLKSGFEVFGELHYGGVDWSLVICDWRAPR